MKRLLVLSLVAMTLGHECGVPRNANKYIVGGDPANRLEFPWQISLQASGGGVWSHQCGGSIIDERWIFTAAHCVDPRFVGVTPQRVVTGKHDLSKPDVAENFFEISRGDIASHPKWEPIIGEYDYALIRLSRPLNFTATESHLTPICLPKPTDATRFDNMICMASGWGLAGKEGEPRFIPALLQKIKLKVLTHQQCAAAWEHSGPQFPRITMRHVCAASIQGEGHGACNGDSGGPLQCFTEDNRWTLAGAVSFGKYCGSEAFPSVFARTTEALDWIERVRRDRA